MFLINAPHNNNQLGSTQKPLPNWELAINHCRGGGGGNGKCIYVYVILVENPCAIGNELKVK